MRQALAGTEFILGIGLDSVDFATSVWELETPLANLHLAAADDVALRKRMVAAIDGDLRMMLRRLSATASFCPQGSTTSKIAAIRHATKSALRQPALPESHGAITIHKLIRSLNRTIPAGGSVTVDVGAFKLVFLQQWETDRPKSVFVANGLSSMGYAIPGALGLCKAQPGRPVAAVVGDGALLMYAGELATVARLNCPLVILVVVDEALALIRLKQQRQGVSVYGTEFGATDYERLAAAFGLAYRLLDSVAHAEEILAAAFRESRPILVEARVDKAEYDRFR